MSSESEKYSRWSIYMAAEEVTAAMDKDINDHNEAGGHQDWPYREIVAIAGTQELINIWNDNMLFNQTTRYFWKLKCIEWTGGFRPLTLISYSLLYVWPKCLPFEGGVLGFWGGVWCLGIVFLCSLMMQRSSCRKGDERKKVGFIHFITEIVWKEFYLRFYDPVLASSVVWNTVYPVAHRR